LPPQQDEGAREDGEGDTSAVHQCRALTKETLVQVDGVDRARNVCRLVTRESSHRCAGETVAAPT